VIDKSSDLAESIRTLCKEKQRTLIPDRPDLWEKLTPDYNPGCKRVIVSDDYYPAIANPKTTLETNKIKRITETGIELENGTHHDHDMIVLATGFRTVEFLFPIKVTGTKNRTLADLMIEAQSRYLNTLVSAVLDARGRGARIGIMPKQDRTVAYNEKIQDVLSNSSFADPKCGSWYKNKEGKITNNWSGTVVEYQKMLSKIDWDDFETTGGQDVNTSASKVVFGSGKQETKIGRVREETYVSNTTLVLGTVSAAAAGAAWAYRTSLSKRLGFGR
jgi:hypothetical protein